MTKEQLYVKWLMTPDLKSDIEAVIATEIAKVKEQLQSENLKWNCSTFDMSRLVDQEYKPTDQVIDQVTDQVQNAKPFDKDRFEAMYRAVYQSTTSNFDKCIEYTKENLTKLDAYYASKEGGDNG